MGNLQERSFYLALAHLLKMLQFRMFVEVRGVNGTLKWNI